MGTEELPLSFSPAEEAMFVHIAASDGAFFKSSLRGQAEMAEAEKVELLRFAYARSRPAFLARYAPFMEVAHLDCFEGAADSEAALAKAVRDIARRLGKAGIGPASPPTSPTSPSAVTAPPPPLSQRAKNRRYNALRRLIQEGDYFSDEEMKAREPSLYATMIDRYMTEEERQKEFGTGAEGGRQPLSEMLTTLAQAQDSAASATNGAVEEGTIEISPQEKERLRAEFTSIMHERFLGGKDSEHFEYSTVDDNSDFDPMDLIARDQEDKYFDEESPS